MAARAPGSATNLIGRRVNDGVVTVDAQFFNIKDTDSAHAVKTRMKESKGWPAPAPLSPSPPRHRARARTGTARERERGVRNRDDGGGH